MGRLQGKIAVVLGAAGEGNMGQVIARRFAAEGATVVVAGRQLAPLQTLANEIGGLALACDITQKADVLALVERTVAVYGRLDVAVNATGWGLMGKILDTTEEQLDKVSALQFKGPYFFLQSVVPAMVKSGGRFHHPHHLRVGLSGVATPCRLHRDQSGRRRAYALFRQRVRRQGHPHQFHRTGIDNDSHDAQGRRSARFAGGVRPGVSLGPHWHPGRCR